MNTSVQPPPEGDTSRDVEHDVRKVFKEHARAHLAFGPFGHDAERDFAEALVRVRHGDEEDVGSGDPGKHRQKRDRTHQAQQADAARLQRHELAVG